MSSKATSLEIESWRAAANQGIKRTARCRLCHSSVAATRCRFLYEVVSLDVGGETTRTTG